MDTLDKTIIESVLWDVDIEKIDLEKYRYFIIERILKYGLPKQINWLLDNYSAESIIEVVKRSKNIDRKTANYWAIHFLIPKEEVLCLKRQLIQDCFY